MGEHYSSWVFIYWDCPQYICINNWSETQARKFLLDNPPVKWYYK